MECPFYKGNQQSEISCEGFVEGSTITQRFRRRSDYETQLDEFCCKSYKRCEIYRMLMAEKYEEEGAQ